ncbi:hypothetical protein C8J57DRAFT_1512318 [Mycena rebaudengoi]|nr:hypothetical protein C8J57DRAFT_1512318 [Mycena rebaudengoi]
MSAVLILKEPRNISPQVIVFKGVSYIGSPGLLEMKLILRYFKSADDDTTYPAKGLYKCDFMICLLQAEDPEDPEWTTAEPEQYISANADAKRAAEESNKVAPKSVFPPFWLLPRLALLEYAGFSGYLAGINSAFEGEKMMDRFRIEVDTIAFMGPCPAAAKATITATPTQATFMKKTGSNWSNSGASGKHRRDKNDNAGRSSSPFAR